MSVWTKSTASGIIAVVIIAVFTPESNWWSSRDGKIVGNDELALSETFFQAGDELAWSEKMPTAERTDQDSFIQLNPKFVFKLNEMSKGNYSLPRNVLHSIKSLAEEYNIETPILAHLDEDADANPAVVRMELDALLAQRLTDYEALHQKLLRSHSEFALCEENHESEMHALQHELNLLDADHKTCQSEQALIDLGVAEACMRRDQMANAMQESHETDCYTGNMAKEAFNAETGLPDVQKLVEIEAIFQKNQRWYSDNALTYNALDQVCQNRLPKKADCDAKLQNIESALLSLPPKQWKLCSELSECYVRSKENFEKLVGEIRLETSKLQAMQDSIFDIMCLMDDPANYSPCKASLYEQRAMPEKVHYACDNYRAPGMLSCEVKNGELRLA